MGNGTGNVVGNHSEIDLCVSGDVNPEASEEPGLVTL